MRRWVAFLILGLAAGGSVRAAEDEAALLERWRKAGPDERRRLAPTLDELERARRYASARPVLVEVAGRRIPLAQLFETVLEPALRAPVQPESPTDLGLTDLHREALAALEALQRAYAPPSPVRTGTLNLLLGYAARALASRAIPPHLRLRFFRDAVRNVRALDGRVRPDARTAWIVRERLLPEFLALARRAGKDDRLRETISEAASLLYLPGILDERAQAQLAPLTRGVHARDVLVRFYQAGILDDLGRVALVRSVAAQVRDDPAFAAGAPPLLLQMLCDPRIAPRERGTLIDLVLDRLADVEVLRPATGDLLAAAFGGPPRPLADYREERALRKGGVKRPEGERVFRFLSVVLVQERPDAPPEIARVVRRDARLYEPLVADDGRGARRFLGTLLPDPKGEHADFVGPPPGVGGRRDNRLLRRRLRLERISIATYGPRAEEIELCVTLPEDDSEPVPPRSATLDHLVALVGARLRRATERDERRELVRLLLRVGTDPARHLAMRHADTEGALRAMVPLAEKGDLAAARLLLSRLDELPLVEREQALAAILSVRRPELAEGVLRLCRDGDVPSAALAADALLATGDPRGVEQVLGHADRYARACGAALALRLTPLAGSLRIVPKDPPDLKRLGDLAGKAFRAEDGDSFVRLGSFAKCALEDPEAVRRRRLKHKPLYLGKRSVLGWEFCDAYARAVRAGEARELWPALVVFLLDPNDPANGILDRHLEPLLDALEERAKEPPLRRAWIDGLVVLACAQSGLETDGRYLELAHGRLARLAGEGAPRAAQRKAGIYWPIWAHADAQH